MEAKDRLYWNENLGIGYLEVTDSPYDDEYFDKYVSYEDAEIGKKLNKARQDLAAKYPHDELLDIGVGSGVFIRDLPNAYGYDINPKAVEYLKSIDKWSDPRAIDMMTFWDSLEHIPEPEGLLELVKKYVIISTPIYDDKDHVLRSKHFRPDEHCWYFTIHGMIHFMDQRGFKLAEYNRIESDLGREDIGTFVFVRQDSYK